VAKKFENSCGTPGLEKSNSNQDLPTEKLRSILRQRLIASEKEEWLRATQMARKSAKTTDRWLNAIATGRNVIFVLWAEPAVSFRKKVRLLCESNRPGAAYENSEGLSHIQIL